MECLIVKKDGILESKYWDYNEEIEKGEYKLRKIEVDSPIILFHLNEIIELEDGFTVRDWFKLLINYPFLQALDGFIKSYLEEYKNCPESNCLDPDKKVHTICIQKIISFDNYGEDDNYDCNIYVDIYGKADDENQHYGIDFWPLKNYLDTPMKLIPGITFRETWNKIRGKNSKTEWGERETVNIYYTLFDFISSYIFEISFMGTPDQRDEKGEELNETVQRIRDGKEELIPLDLDELWGEKE